MKTSPSSRIPLSKTTPSMEPLVLVISVTRLISQISMSCFSSSSRTPHEMVLTS